MREVKTCDAYLVTCEIKHRKKIPGRIVMGVFSDEALAHEQAEQIFQEERKKFLDRIQNTSNYKPFCLEDQKNSWSVAYQPCGSWELREFVKIHVEPNYIRTDLIGGCI